MNESISDCIAILRLLAKDWEKTIASAETWLLIAHIRRVTRMLARA